MGLSELTRIALYAILDMVYRETARTPRTQTCAFDIARIPGMAPEKYSAQLFALMHAPNQPFMFRCMPRSVSRRNSDRHCISSRPRRPPPMRAYISPTPIARLLSLPHTRGAFPVARRLQASAESWLHLPAAQPPWHPRALPPSPGSIPAALSLTRPPFAPAFWRRAARICRPKRSFRAGEGPTVIDSGLWAAVGKGFIYPLGPVEHRWKFIRWLLMDPAPGAFMHIMILPLCIQICNQFPNSASAEVLRTFRQFCVNNNEVVGAGFFTRQALPGSIPPRQAV